MGAEGTVDGHRVIVGNQRLLEARGVAVAAPDAQRSDVRDRGATAVFVAADNQPIGLILVADRPRDTAKEAIEMLREHVAHVVMLTGDHPDVAALVAKELGVDEFHAGLMPEQKHAKINELRASYGPVLMVGDGVNDAPALAIADVGVAMGAAGSDAALETADVALLSDELLKLPYAARLARATMRNIKTNIAISLVLKAMFLLMAVGGVATLWMAILADTGASVIVVVNALRLLRAK